MKTPAWMPPALLITGGTVAVLSATIASGATLIGGVLLGTALSQTCLFYLLHNRTKAQHTDDKPDIESQRLALEEWHQAQSEQLRRQSERLQEQQRSLLTQRAQIQEFLEYPVSGEYENRTPDLAIRLSEQDRQVHAILEAEAERVYEKIRANGYTRNGNVDVDMIRVEVHELVLKVAKVYSPDSNDPLLETSFEQLARSASRVCLHTLVLLEQLPLDVKSYNIREMYSYIQKAVQGYGTYQQVAPWLKHLTRGAYVGRLAAGTNPVSLGAWWLATEVGRRGAQKLVENVVDRQAVAALNDIVTIIGVEVANIYGPGFRQRDAAWVYGAELTELLHRFPVSRDSLQRGLREITALPLRSEYDRIYLYRCVADHRSSGLRIADPAVLTRDEREQVAAQLEAFFTTSIHGVTPKEKEDWQQDVESRLDLRMKLSGHTSKENQADTTIEAVRAAYTFLVSVAGATSEQATQFLEVNALITHVPVDQRAVLWNELADAEARFEPPDLDPSADAASAFLDSIMTGAIATGRCDENVEELLIETACYFRRSREESVAMLDEAFRTQLQNRCAAEISVKRLDPAALRVLSRNLKSAESITSVYDGISLLRRNDQTEQQDGVLSVFQSSENESKRLLLLSSSEALWTAEDTVSTKRNKGFLIDDCIITGGTWHSAAAPKADAVVVAGTLTGGGYQKYFEPLLSLSHGEVQSL